MFLSSSRGQLASKQIINKWVVMAISLAYEVCEIPSPLLNRAHSKRSMASSQALLAGASIQDICNATGWPTLPNFIRHYSLYLSFSPGSQGRRS